MAVGYYDCCTVILSKIDSVQEGSGIFRVSSRICCFPDLIRTVVFNIPLPFHVISFFPSMSLFNLPIINDEGKVELVNEVNIWTVRSCHFFSLIRGHWSIVLCKSCKKNISVSSLKSIRR